MEAENITVQWHSPTIYFQQLSQLPFAKHNKIPEVIELTNSISVYSTVRVSIEWAAEGFD